MLLYAVYLPAWTQRGTRARHRARVAPQIDAASQRRNKQSLLPDYCSDSVLLTGVKLILPACWKEDVKTIRSERVRSNITSHKNPGRYVWRDETRRAECVIYAQHLLWDLTVQPHSPHVLSWIWSIRRWSQAGNTALKHLLMQWESGLLEWKIILRLLQHIKTDEGLNSHSTCTTQNWRFTSQRGDN